MAMEELREALRQGAATLGVPLQSPQQDQLLGHLALLQKWGAVYNLTAVRDPLEMLHHHLLDSLSVVAPLGRHLESIGIASGEGNYRLLDVGSGAGLPGVVLAVCFPGLQVQCVDTVAKKAAFIQQAALQLGVPNLRGVHGRVEKLQGHFDVVTSRAFASLADFTRWSRHLLAPQGVWMAMKGKFPDEEIAALDPSVEVFHVEQLAVPGLDAQRCLLWMRPQQSL